MNRVAAPKRFELLRCLGEGGMGVVFEARDHERGGHVALKMLRSLASDAIVRFKREFRLLQDLQHPNIVRFGELICEGDEWFFTMELVLGKGFLGYVCENANAWWRSDRASGMGLETPRQASSGAITADALAGGGSAQVMRARSWPEINVGSDPAGLARASRPGGRGSHSFDEARLRAALRQLAAGLSAVHEAGLVHRDIKPSNIRVTRDERLVLLDFGLVRQIGAEISVPDQRVLGTPGYMAPEQAAGAVLGPEADCYSVGILLYEALTGTKPFAGGSLAVLEEKQQREATPPRAIAPGIPADLDALCVALVRRDPAARPTARGILRALGGDEPEEVTRALATRLPSVGSDRPFVGREREVDELLRAFDDARGREAAQVIVTGESGIGKTCLVRHFLRLLRARAPDTLVLSGRCYERESVPYKAFDGVIDALAQALGQLSDSDVRALLPARLGPLVQVFPVLRMVPAIEALAREPLRVEPIELRSRAFLALRDLLTRFAARRRLVVTIDDAQWADDDSRLLLADLVRPPGSPSLLLVATMRTGQQAADAVSSAKWVRAIRSGPESQPRLRVATAGGQLAPLPGVARAIDLHPFSYAEGCELASVLLAAADPTGLANAGEIAQEAGGHPFFIETLVRHHTLAVPRDRDRAVRLSDALLYRIDALDEVARQIMEVAAVAGAPIARDTLALAVTAEEGVVTRQVGLLRAEHFLQRSPGGAGVRTADAVDVYHDRIRAAVLARLDPDARKAIHRRLALALEASSSRGESEALANHWRAAGDLARAANYAASAADEAARSLAFDRATRLYRLSMKLQEPGPERASSTWTKLGEALANSGQGAQAARAFQTAAAASPSAMALELHRRAAEQLLRAGHFDEGLAAIRTVLDRCGMRLPATPFIALLLFLLWRGLVRVRGLGFRPRDASEVPAPQLTEIDVAWSVAMGLGMVDNIRGATFQARHLLLALRAGEPVRVARALALEVAYLARGGGATWRRTQVLMARAQRVAERTGRPEAIGFAIATSGFAYHLAGKFRPALELLDRSYPILRDESAGMSWEIASVQHNAIMCLAHLGELKELCRRRPVYLREALDRGDLYATVNLRIGSPNLVWLVADDPTAARGEASDAMGQWSKQGFHVEHYLAMIARVQTDLYCSEGLHAYAFIRKQWPALRRSLLLTVQVIRIMSHWARGRCAIAASVARSRKSPSSSALAVAEADVRALERERWGWSLAMASQLRAGIAMVQRREEEAARRLEEAIARYAREDMALHGTAARRCLGGLIGGDRGRALVTEADRWFAGEGVRDPGRFAATFAPGFLR